MTAGDWEGYIAEDLVAHVDRNYRTIAARESRGLAGHSMGGYGTMRIGMKRPDVFAAIALDIGPDDSLIASNRVIVDALTRYGIAHTFETYEGDHSSRIAHRLEQKVLPFFSEQLSFDQPRGQSTRR